MSALPTRYWQDLPWPAVLPGLEAALKAMP